MDGALANVESLIPAERTVAGRNNSLVNQQTTGRRKIIAYLLLAVTIISLLSTILGLKQNNSSLAGQYISSFKSILPTLEEVKNTTTNSSITRVLLDAI